MTLTWGTYTIEVKLVGITTTPLSNIGDVQTYWITR